MLIASVIESTLEAGDGAGVGAGVGGRLLTGEKRPPAVRIFRRDRAFLPDGDDSHAVGAVED
jgi:hypothetical protein